MLRPPNSEILEGLEIWRSKPAIPDADSVGFMPWSLFRLEEPSTGNGTSRRLAECINPQDALAAAEVAVRNEWPESPLEELERIGSMDSPEGLRFRRPSVYGETNKSHVSFWLVQELPGLWTLKPDRTDAPGSIWAEYRSGDGITVAWVEVSRSTGYGKFSACLSSPVLNETKFWDEQGRQFDTLRHALFEAQKLINEVARRSPRR